MIYIQTWQKIVIFIVCALSVLYTVPNLISAETRESLEQTLPSWMPHKTVNLGLDLRGGAHLLYEVDVDVVFAERADMSVQDLRGALRAEKIQYARLTTSEDGGVRLSLRSLSDMVAAKAIMRDTLPKMLLNEDEEQMSITAALTEEARAEIYSQTISQSVEIVRRRVDELGTTEPSIARQGEDRLLVQVPGANAEDLKRIVGKTAKLGFHLVSNTRSPSTKMLPMAENPAQKISIARRAIITGEMLDTAAPSFNESGQAVVTFRFNSQGAKRFCKVTRDNVNKPFAIVLDNEVISAPVIREPICGGNGQISGGFDVQGANDLAVLLRAGALPAPLTVMEERTVGPSLGADSIAAGQKASIIAMILVLIFMGVAYGLFGIFANLALLINVFMLFAALSILQATLTLPGIAGIVLTIGMAVDANVLIFERIREEMRAGRTAVSAIDAGYSRAMATIIDSNLTTLIAAAILFSFGTGPIKGFAVTLGLGIMTSFFSAIMLTRLFVVLWLRGRRPAKLPV